MSETLVKDSSKQLSRAKIRRLFRRHRGVSAEVARIAGVTPVVVSNWLADRIESANVEQHARAKADELLAKSAGGSHA